MGCCCNLIIGKQQYPLKGTRTPNGGWRKAISAVHETNSNTSYSPSAMPSYRSTFYPIVLILREQYFYDPTVDIPSHELTARILSENRTVGVSDSDSEVSALVLISNACVRLCIVVALPAYAIRLLRRRPTDISQRRGSTFRRISYV